VTSLHTARTTTSGRFAYSAYRLLRTVSYRSPVPATATRFSKSEREKALLRCRTPLAPFVHSGDDHGWSRAVKRYLRMTRSSYGTSFSLQARKRRYIPTRFHTCGTQSKVRPCTSSTKTAGNLGIFEVPNGCDLLAQMRERVSGSAVRNRPRARRSPQRTKHATREASHTARSWSNTKEQRA